MLKGYATLIREQQFSILVMFDTASGFMDIYMFATNRLLDIGL